MARLIFVAMERPDDGEWIEMEATVEAKRQKSHINGTEP